MNNYEAVIGLEIHVELSTRSKMFCSNSSHYFGEDPNIHTCPICLGLPGALPYINKKALESCMKIGLALGCEIAKESRFERKNYFYPDLPKGYQISQYRWPLCVNGSIEVTNKDKELKTIRINRVHQEEDTGKLTHSRENTHIDYNRSSVPLVEIVTEPDFRDTEEIRDYAKKLQQICRYLKVSNADMEKGDMRLEANVSVRKVGETDLPPYRVELKNINSFRFMVAAVEYEIKRQIEAHEKGETLVQETRGWDEDAKKTFTQRVKEEANDYRYFPDPDLPPFEVGEDWLASIKAEMPELPKDRIERFVKEYELAPAHATILADSQDLAIYFEDAAKIAQEHGLPVSKVANTLINKKFDRDEISPAKFVRILLTEASKAQLSEDELDKAVSEAIAENEKAVEDYRNGKEVSLQFLVGQVMAKTKGQADASKAREELVKKING